MVRGNAFYISVLMPVAAILLSNLTDLLVVIVKLHNHGKRKQIGPLLRLFADTRIAFTCNILLGCTWVFALFAVGKALRVFQWFFLHIQLTARIFYISILCCSKLGCAESGEQNVIKSSRISKKTTRNIDNISTKRWVQSNKVWFQ